ASILAAASSTSSGMEAQREELMTVNRLARAIVAEAGNGREAADLTRLRAMATELAVLLERDGQTGANPLDDLTYWRRAVVAAIEALDAPHRVDDTDCQSIARRA